MRAALLAHRRDERLLGRFLQAEIDRGAGGQHELALALGDALHLLEGPVEEPVGAGDAAVLDGLGRVQARVMHLGRRVEAGFDEIDSTSLVRAREAGRLMWGANLVGALKRPAMSAASARLTSRTDLPK